jgi:Ca-activated chloride channel homolog
MTDRDLHSLDLHSLQDSATPAPRADAKARALAAAMAAFDEPAKNSTAATQGTAAAERPTTVTSLKKERSWMRLSPKAYVPLAASIIAMVAAAPFLMRAFVIGPQPTPMVAATKARISPPKTVAAAPPAVPAPAARPTAIAVAAVEQGNWVKFCEPDNGKTSCLVQHERIDGNTGAVFFSVSLREEPHQNYLMVVVPLSLDLRAGVELRIDQGDMIKIPQAKVCHSAGCTYEVLADAALVTRLKAGTTLTITGERKVPDRISTFTATTFAVPLAGFAEAMAGPATDSVTLAAQRGTLMKQIASRQEQLYKDYLAQQSAVAGAKVAGNAGVRPITTVPVDRLGRVAAAEPAPVPGMTLALPPAAAALPAKRARQSSDIVADVAKPARPPAKMAAASPARLAEAEEQRFGFRGDAKIKGVAAETHAGVLCTPEQACWGPIPSAEPGRDQYDAPPPNATKSTATEPVSTFSVDVDTASYALARRHLTGGHLPPRASVRVEEMINYFRYDYRRPESATAPFEPQITVTANPWNANTKLLHIGLKGYEIKAAERPRANIVLLVDISGSMQPADRLPLLKTAFRQLMDELKPDDTVAIVTYASGSDIRLAPTRVADKTRILSAIDSLNAGGSTAGAAGITDAYRVAEANFDPKGVNRIILGTDGDWNVGITNREQLKTFIEAKRKSGVFLSILGVGMGNHNDALMQTLAQNGNGVAAYIDTLSEARKVLVDEVSSALFTIAKDVKIQIEFNPTQVAEYRLIGYETRALKREDFANDKVDAGDVGSGHSVTAIYEITPVGSPAVALPDLRYGPAKSADAPRVEPVAKSARDGEYGFFKLRYKLPNEEQSRLIELPIAKALETSDLAGASDDVRFSIAVAAYGQLLRGLPAVAGMTFDDVVTLANSARGPDPFGLRAEFVNLARSAKQALPAIRGRL